MPYKDPEMTKKKNRERYLAKRGEILAKTKQYYETHKERQKETRKRWQLDHPEKMLAYAAKWRRENPEKNLARQRDYKERLRKQVFDHYGSKCSCCGVSHREFLAIDHIHGGGNKHRREEKITNSADLYLWIIRHDFPDTFRILCHNCNASRGFYGFCPHTRRGKEMDKKYSSNH